MVQGGCIVDYHSCDFFPERFALFSHMKKSSAASSSAAVNSSPY